MHRPGRDLVPLSTCLRPQRPLTHCPTGGSLGGTVRKVSVSSLNFELNCLTWILVSGFPTDSTITQKSNLVPLSSPRSTGMSKLYEKYEKGRKAQSPALLSKSRLLNEILNAKATTKYRPILKTGVTTSAATPGAKTDVKASSEKEKALNWH